MYLNVTNLIVACKHPLGSTVTPGRHDFSSRCQIWQRHAEKKEAYWKTRLLLSREGKNCVCLWPPYSLQHYKTSFSLCPSILPVLYSFFWSISGMTSWSQVFVRSLCVSVCQDWCLRCWYWKAIKQQVCLCLSLEVVISFRRSALAQQSSLKLLQCVPTRNAHTLLPARNESKKSFKTI